MPDTTYTIEKLKNMDGFERLQNHPELKQLIEIYEQQYNKYFELSNQLDTFNPFAKDQQPLKEQDEYIKAGEQIIEKLDMAIHATQQAYINAKNAIKYIIQLGDNQVDPKLLLLIQNAISKSDDKQDQKPLKATEIATLKKAIGEELFNYLIKKYELIEQNISIDNIRMLIIGILGTPINQQWLNNNFIKHLLAHYDLYGNISLQPSLEELAIKAQALRQKINKDPNGVLKKTWDRIRATPKTTKLATFGLTKVFIPSFAAKSSKILTSMFAPYFNTALENIPLLLSFATTANSKFNRDLETFSAIARIDDWQQIDKPANDPSDFSDTDNNITDEDDNNTLSFNSSLIFHNDSSETNHKKKFSAKEYTFNKLSVASLQEDSIIPVIETDGKIHYYTVKNLIHKPGIHGIALIPINPHESQEIKIVFQSSTNLAAEITDTENKVTHHQFEKYKNDIFINLNTIIHNFKQNIPQDQQENLTINIGGHGRGGALAQHLIHSLIGYKLAKQLSTINLSKEDLEKIIDEQYEYEIAHYNHNTTPTNVIQKIMQYIYSYSDFRKSLDKLHKDNPEQFKEEYKKQIKDHFTILLENGRKQLQQINISELSELINLNHFILSTINSGGIPIAIRNGFITALAILKNILQDSMIIECDKMMVKGNPMQLTGDTDLAAYVPYKLMPTTLMMLDPNKSKLSLALKAGVDTAIFASYYILYNYTILLQQFLSILRSWNKLNKESAVGKTAKEIPYLKHMIPEQEKQILLDLFNIIKDSHLDSFLDKDNPKYQLMSNNPHLDQLLSDPNLLDLELSSKIPKFLNNRYAQAIKAYHTNNFEFLYNLLEVAGTTINSLITSTDHLPFNHKENMEKIIASYKALKSSSKIFFSLTKEIAKSQKFNNS